MLIGIQPIAPHLASANGRPFHSLSNPLQPTSATATATAAAAAAAVDDSLALCPGPRDPS